jgi:septum formation protein
MRMSRPQLVLASASPRRCELLTQIGIVFEQWVAAIDETPRAGEAPADYVQRVALEKARAVHADGRARLPVLGADTVVVVDGRLLGKPRDADHGRAMLRQLSGRRHEVFSAVALIGRREAVAVSRSAVWFRDLSEDDIAAYWRHLSNGWTGAIPASWVCRCMKPPGCYRILALTYWIKTYDSGATGQRNTAGNPRGGGRKRGTAGRLYRTRQAPWPGG